MIDEDLGVSAEWLTLVAEAAGCSTEELAAAIERITSSPQSLEEAAAACERAEYLRAERKQWGHPPKCLSFGCNPPVRPIPRRARSSISPPGGRRRRP